MADCALWRLEQTTERVQIQRPVEIKTLDEITTGLSDQVEFVLGLHTFDTDLFAKTVAGIDNACDKVQFLLGGGDPVDQRLIQFDQVGRML